MEIDMSDWATVEYNGDTYKVLPTMVGPVGIKEAADLAKLYGCELPTPGLVDAIFKASDAKFNALDFVISHNGTIKEMASPEVLQAQVNKIEKALGDYVLNHGPFNLSAGYAKDVVMVNGKLGLYGFHRPNGKVIQPLYTKHSTSWKDYSQFCRLVKKVQSA